MKRVLPIFLAVVIFTYAGIYFVRNFKVQDIADNISEVQAETNQVQSEVNSYQSDVDELIQRQLQFIADIQEYIVANGEYRQRIAILEQAIQTKNAELAEYQADSQQYISLNEELSTLNSELDALNGEYQTLQSDLDNLINNNNTIDVYESLLTQYTKLTEQSIRVSELYRRLLNLLGVDENVDKANELADIESTINSINASLTLIQSNLADINNNNSIIDTIKAKTTNNGYGNHIVMVTYSYTDEFFSTEITKYSQMSSLNKPYLFVGTGSSKGSQTSYLYMINNTYYPNSVTSTNYNLVRYDRTAGQKVVAVISVNEQDLLSANYLEIAVPTFHISSESSVQYTVNELPDYFNLVGFYQKSEGTSSTLTGDKVINISNYGQAFLTLSIDINDTLPDVINIDLVSSVEPIENNGVEESVSMITYDFNSYSFN